MAKIPYNDVIELDEVLKKNNMRRHSVPSDGNAFYHSVAHQLSILGKNFTHSSVRAMCVEYLKNNTKIFDVKWSKVIDTGETTKEYMKRHSCEGEKADDIIVQATASSLGYVITIVTASGQIRFEPQSNKMGEITIGRMPGLHYVSLYVDAKISTAEPPSLFNLRDHVTSGILKQTKSDVKLRSHRQHEEEPSYENTRGMNGPGMNPTDDDDFYDPHDFEDQPIVTPPYDTFICEPPEDDSRTTTNTIKFFQKGFKLISFFIFGGAALTGALVSKACLMILVNSAKPYNTTHAMEENYEGDNLEHDMIRVWSYIILLIMLLFPEVLTMMYSLYRIIMKSESKVDMKTLLLGGLLEFLHAVGEGILILKVLPYLDSTVALLMLPLVGIVPIVVNIYAKIVSVSRNKKRQATEQFKRVRNLVLAITAFVLQVVGLIFCFVCFFTDNWFTYFKDGDTYIWAFFGIILTSLRYWENFITCDIKIGKFSINAMDLHQKLDNSRFLTSFIFSLMKCLVLVGMTFLVLVVLENDTYTSKHAMKDGLANSDVDNVAFSAVRYSKILGLFTHAANRPKFQPKIISQLWYVFATQVCCAFAAFFFGRVSCMTRIQRESYTFPMSLVTPIISSCSAALAVYKQTTPQNVGLLAFVGLDKKYKSIVGLNYYLDWNNVLFPGLTRSDATTDMVVMVIVGLILGWLAIMLVTLFLWDEARDRLQRMEVLFVKPLYGGPLIDQVLLLNRRQFEKKYSKERQKKEEENERKRSEKEQKSSSSKRSIRRRSSRRLTVSRRDKFTPQLFLCATMWHETVEEMTQILTSLMRLDSDQGSRRGNATTDEDYYNFQVHILFDDAMELSKDGKDTKTNKFVHQLCELIPLAANKVELGKGYDLPDPVIYPTPYGGRLEFIMPHGNLMVVHLKDKQKIRHRKRWSQCMYMYYILGFLQATKKAYKLEDIFLLALDGDVDFQPAAVLLLLDRMKRNPDVGAACGRIHPTGSGPMVWFQKFEYAVGHWLQKTTEHVLGCVLCSPGCFSLFRGAALVDVNVMNQYTKKATEARHYVQWDQGEDRWLCTLLLKQGWRIEYSAASDSFTFAPEDFKEFYNQRRRWGPSTMANVFDILMDAKLAVKNNMYISWGYIVYQIGLMASSLLGPATVIMIVQGALQYVFHWDATVSLIVSLIPVVLFIILCYTTSADTQVAVAGILTIMYALVMMAVIVGVIGGLATNALFDPNNIFMIMLVGMYAFTGLIHPQELMCLVHGILYYLSVPSAFILLMVYSLVNMNNVSWGTREVKQATPEHDTATEQALQEVASKPSGKKMQVGPSTGSIYDGPDSSEGYYSCGLGNLCQCALCITPKPPVYQPVPTTEVRQHQPSRRLTQMSRRTTLGPNGRQSVYKKFSVAKAEQISGLEPDKIEQSLHKRMSVAQLRRISTKMGRDSISTSQLRKMSTRHRRLSKRSFQQHGTDGTDAHTMSQAAHMLADELTQEQPLDNFSDDEYDEDVGMERLQDEEDEMLYWVIEGSLEDGVIEYLDNEERDFWKYLIDKYLYPLDENKAEKEKIKSDLLDLRNKMTGAYFLANALWLILNFALQLTITDIAITYWVNGEMVSMNPVSFAFLIFFLIILVIQFTCMLAHRWSTALHLLSVTSLKWRDRRDGIKNVKKKDLEQADARHKARPNKKPNQNGRTQSDVNDPVLDREIMPGSNFSFRSRDEGHDNPTYDTVTIEGDEANPSSGSDTDENTYENTYEKIGIKSRFNNPVNRLFSSSKERYGATDEVRGHKKSAAIPLEMFNDDASSDNGLISRSADTRQDFDDIGDAADHRVHAEVHHVEQEAKPTRPHTTGVHFGPLPSVTDEEGDTPF